MSRTSAEPSSTCIPSSSLHSLTEGNQRFLDVLQSGTPMIWDAAMGSALYSSGYFTNRAFDEANITDPARVCAIHVSHIKAGAELIETNTFSANRIMLNRYGISDKVVEINQSAIKIAREAASECGRPMLFIAGSVGPSGDGGGFWDEEKSLLMRQTFEEQIYALMDGGVDLIAAETFHDLQELRLVISIVKSRCKRFPVTAQLCFDEDGCLKDGTTCEKAAEYVAQWGADMAGVSCSAGWGRIGEGGPAVSYEVAMRMVKSNCHIPIVVCANAGSPKRVDNRLIFMNNPEYCGVYARRMYKGGVRAVGGCCGTTSEHLVAIAAAARMLRGGASVIPSNDDGCEYSPVSSFNSEIDINVYSGLPEVPMAEKSLLGAKLYQVWTSRLQCGKIRKAPENSDDFVVSVEVNPSLGLKTDKPIAAATAIINAGVDVINIADGPRASVRMSNQSLALQMKSILGITPIIHVCCRDRNVLGLQSDILGYHVMGLHNLVIITGDPPKMGSYPKATAVFDMDSIQLIQMVKRLNCGIDLSGKNIDDQTKFLIACGVEPAAVDFEREMKRLEAKVRSGADFIMTQPVYDAIQMQKFLDELENRNMYIPVLMGVCPLVSAKNAEFLHNEVPGMSVPEVIRKRMSSAERGEAALAEGVAIAQEMVNQFKDRIVGIYIMPQLGKYREALQVLAPLGYSL